MVIEKEHLRQIGKETRKQGNIPNRIGGHILHIKNEPVETVAVGEGEKRRIIDLHFNQGKTIRELSRIRGKSSHDITSVTKEHRIRLAQDYAPANGYKSGVLQCEQDRVIPNVKAYKLFDEGKSPLEVATKLNLAGTQVQQFYGEYLNMIRMHNLVSIYQEIQDSMGYFLKLFRLGKENGVSPEQIMNPVQMADSIHRIQDKLRYLKGELLELLFQ